MQDLVAFLPLIGIALVFWLLVIRPQSRRQRELRHMQSSLDVGNRVVLTSGVYGTLTEVTDQIVGLEVADGVRITVARAAVGQVVDPKIDRESGGTGPEDSEES